MPLPVDNLTPDSGAQAIRDAISKSIEQCISEGKEQKQCAAMSYKIARQKTGKSLGEGRA